MNIFNGEYNKIRIYRTGLSCGKFSRDVIQLEKARTLTKEHSRAEFSISCLTCNSQCICSQVMMNLPTSPWGHSCSITLHPKFDHFYWLNCCLTRIQYRTQTLRNFSKQDSENIPSTYVKKVSSLRARDKMCLQAGVSPRPIWPLTPKVESVAFACSSTNCIFRLGYVFLRIDPQVRLGIRHVL